MKTIVLSVFLLLGVYSYGQFHLGENYRDTYSFFKSEGHDVSYSITKSGMTYIEVRNQGSVSGFYSYDNIIVSVMIIPDTFSEELAFIEMFNKRFFQIDRNTWYFYTPDVKYLIKRIYDAELSKNYFSIDIP